MAHLLEHDALSVGSASKWIGLPSCSQVGLFVVQISPSLNPSILDVFSCGPDTRGFTHDEKFDREVPPRRRVHKEKDVLLRRNEKQQQSCGSHTKKLGTFQKSSYLFSILSQLLASFSENY